MKDRQRHARGFTLISTLFLIVVVSGLAGYLVNLSVAQQTTTALSINATRARLAAGAGLDWVAYRIANVSNDCPSGPVTLTIEGFAVAITSCAVTDTTEGGLPLRLIDVTVEASRGSFGNADFVRHALRATLRGS
jgi:MSHA biogenesis protein MshP